MVTRRKFVAGGLAALSAAKAFANTPSLDLGAIARRKGLIYGTAVNGKGFAKDLRFRELLAAQANMLVCEGATKRQALEPKPGIYDYSEATAVLDFANQHKMKMRGHTLVWHLANPKWLLDALQDKPSEALITDYITEVAGHFRGKFQSWDVINEVLSPDDWNRDGMRSSSPWFKAFGERYIDIAFHAAKAADPNTLLFYNELNLEADARWSEDKRTSALKLIERLKSRGVPIEGLGIQSHLKLYRLRYDDRIFSRFLDDVGAMGLKVMLTEFDIADAEGPRDPAKRDADVASLTKRYLDVAFSKPFVLGCLTWGISDKYSWLSKYENYKWADGSLSRGLPFDENFKPKPMWQAMASAYEGAKGR